MYKIQGIVAAVDPTQQVAKGRLMRIRPQRIYRFRDIWYANRRANFNFKTVDFMSWYYCWYCVFISHWIHWIF